MQLPPKWPKQESVCLCEEQSVLGLEVEVISLIGSLPCSLPTSPLLPLSSLSPNYVIFSHLLPLSLPCYLSQSFSFSLFLSSTPSLSCYLPLFISHLFSAAGCLWSLQSTQGIQTSIARGDRDRRDEIREREKEKRWEKLSHWLRVTLITVSWQHTRAHSLMADRANSIYT